MASLLRRRCVIAAKNEATPGTAEALVASDGAINCFNLEFPDQNYNMEERPQQGTFNNLPAVSGARTMTISFETEAVGSGDSAEVNTVLAALLKICGYAQSTGVFTPTADPASMSTATVAYYHDGKRRLLVGCAGTFTLSIRNGKRSMFKFSITGKPAPDTDTALISPTFPTVVPPRGLASLSMNSLTSLRVAELMFDAGAVVKMLEDTINDTNGTGYAFGIIADRMSKATIDPEASLVATANWESLQTTPTEFALSAVIGSVTHNTITVAAVSSSAQVMQRGLDERQGVLAEKLNLNINKGFTLTFA